MIFNLCLAFYSHLISFARSFSFSFIMFSCVYLTNLIPPLSASRSNRMKPEPESTASLIFLDMLFPLFPKSLSFSYFSCSLLFAFLVNLNVNLTLMHIYTIKNVFTLILFEFLYIQCFSRFSHRA